MRLRTANCRFLRQSRTAVPKGEPFCYLVYLGRKVVHPVFVDGRHVNYEVRRKEHIRPFPNYVEAIAHLTRVKLAIDEEDREWKATTPCKIVEGVYTKSRKEKIIKITRLNDECDRPPERHFSSGLPRQQRGVSFPVPKIMATDQWLGSWSSGTIASSSTATAVVDEWDEYYRLSH